MIKYIFTLFIQLFVIALCSSQLSAGYAIKDKHQRFYQKNGFIMGEPLVFTDEKDFCGNEPNLQTTRKTTFKDGLVFDSKNEKLNADNYVYVLNYDGILYTSDQAGGIHHSYLLKSQLGKDLYGIGKNVACAGHLSAKDGKIIEFSNSSGHYLPSRDQLVLAVKHLARLNVLDPHVVINFQDEFGTSPLTLSALLQEDSGAILNRYPTSTTKRTLNYVKSRRDVEIALRDKMADLAAVCPRHFIDTEVTTLLPAFRSPVAKGRTNLGTIELAEKKWRMFLDNPWDLPLSILQAPALAFRFQNHVSSLGLTLDQNKALIRRTVGCTYSIMHTPEPQKGFTFWLVPLAN